MEENVNVTLYRALCEEEYNKTSTNYLSYNRNREKPFGTLEFVLNRVLDGKFNQSAFKDKYSHLISITFDKKYKSQFKKFGGKEAILDSRKSNFPFVINKLGKVNEKI